MKGGGGKRIGKSEEHNDCCVKRWADSWGSVRWHVAQRHVTHTMVLAATSPGPCPRRAVHGGDLSQVEAHTPCRCSRGHRCRVPFSTQGTHAPAALVKPSSVVVTNLPGDTPTQSVCSRCTDTCGLQENTQAPPSACPLLTLNNATRTRVEYLAARPAPTQLPCGSIPLVHLQPDDAAVQHGAIQHRHGQNQRRSLSKPAPPQGAHRHRALTHMHVHVHIHMRQLKYSGTSPRRALTARSHNKHHHRNAHDEAEPCRLLGHAVQAHDDVLHGTHP